MRGYTRVADASPGPDSGDMSVMCSSIRVLQGKDWPLTRPH